MAGNISLELLSGAKFPKAEETDKMEKAEQLLDAEQDESAPVETDDKKPITAMTVKPKGKAKSVSGEVMPNDAIAKAVKSVETLKEEQVRKRLAEMPEAEGFMAFEQGGLLKRVLENNWHQNWGYSDFSAYVETEYDFGKRKAYYLIGMYTALLDAGLTAAQVETIGWTKLRYLLNPKSPVLTVENVDEWVEKASNMTVKQLADSLAETKQLEGPSDPQSVQKMTFKLHADQAETVTAALSKAKEVSGTDVDTVAIEYICMDYLGKPTPTAAQSNPEAPDFKSLMAATGWEQTLGVFEELWPKIELTVVPAE